MFLGMTVPGWASLVASIVFLSGIQLIVLGVIGEYIGKIYREVGRRPAYLISKTNITLPSDALGKGSHSLNPRERRSVMT